MARIKAHHVAGFIQRPGRGIGRLLLSAVLWLVQLPFRILGFAGKHALRQIGKAATGDSKTAVEGDKAAGSWVGVFLSLTLVPWLVYMAALNLHPAFWAVLPVVLGGGLYLAALRSAASQGTHLSPWEFVGQMRRLLSHDGEVGEEPSKENKTAFRIVSSSWALWGATLLIAFAPQIPAVYAAIPNAATRFFWLYPVLGIMAHLVAAAASVYAGRLHHSSSKTQNEEEWKYSSLLAAVFGITQKAFDEGGGRFTFDPSKRVLTVLVPIGALLKLGEIETRCEQIMPQWTCVSTGIDADGVTSAVFERVEDHPDVIDSRLAKANSGGLITAVYDVPDTKYHGAVMWAINSAERQPAARVDALAQARGGKSLIRYDAVGHEALVGILPRAVRSIRDAMARILGDIAPWDIELKVADGHEHIDRIEITRYPHAKLGVEAERRLAKWRELLAVVPGASNGWGIAENPATGIVTMTYGTQRVLPKLVPASGLLPDRLTPEAWNRLPMGVNAAGETVFADLLAGPHSVVAGGTGSGKTVFLRMLMMNAVARGFETVFVDPVKKAAGLKGVIPWTRGFFTTDTDGMKEAAAVAKAIYAEVRRRVDLVDAVDGENWQDLPPEQAVRPILFILDEYASLVTADDKPVGLDRNDPDLAAWQEEASAKASIRSTVGKIAREARSAGVFLVLSLQRPDADVIGGAVRDNLGTAVQLVPPTRPPSPQALAMLFSEENKADAVEEIAQLGDGRSPGFALSYVDGGKVQGFRVGFIEKDDMATYAKIIGAQRLATLPISVDTDKPVVTKLLMPTTTPAPEVVDVGDFAFTLDDFEAPGEAQSPESLLPAPVPVDPRYAFTFEG